MASKKITAMPDWAGNQVSTDLVTGVDLSEVAANQNVKSTLNDLFSIITKNITDGAVRFQEFTAPALSAAGEGSLYFDDTDKTFKGSRNGSAYDDLLFGNGANQQVAVFTSVIDTIAGYAPFYYNNTLTRLYITDASFAPTMEISKTGTTPALFKAFGGQGYASLGNWSATAAAPAYFNFFRGASGPAFPTSGMDIGSIRFRPASNTGDVPTTIGGARIDVRATENATLGVGGGVGLTIYTAANGQVSDTQRMLINSAGVVMLGVNSATITTNAGTDTKTVLGELTTYDSDAIHQIGNPSASDAKILVIQGNAAQTKALTEWQTSAGNFLFSIGAFGSHSYGGTTGIAVSAAGQGRIYFDSVANRFQFSENGSAYYEIGNAPGGTTGSIQYNNGAGLYDGDNYFLWDSASATIQIGSASVLSGKILLRNSTNPNTLTIQPGATSGNITFTLPVDDGAAGQYLQTDGSGALSWATASVSPAGSNKQLQFNNSSSFGGTSGYEYDAAANWTLSGTPAAGKTALVLYEPTSTPPATVVYAPTMLHLHTLDDATYYQLGFSSNGTTVEWANYLASDGSFIFDGQDNGGGSYQSFRIYFIPNTTNGASLAFYPEGMEFVGISGGTLYGGIAQIASDVFGLMLTTNTPTSGAQFPLVFTASGVGINKSSSISAQLHVVSASNSRVGLRVEGAANTSVALNQFYLNANDTASVALHSVFSVDSNGTAATGFGGQLLLQLESSTTDQQDAATINWLWADATHASRTAKMQIQLVIGAAALATVAEFDGDTTAGNTRLLIYDVDNASLERVSVGAADSGGSGFKLLRIPN